MKTKAVLFEFDGIIADTANVHIAAWERTFDQLGWEVPPEVCARSVEVDDDEFLANLFDSRSIEGDVAGWVARKRKLVMEMLFDWPRLYEGIPELIAALSGRVRLGVVSTCLKENILLVLDQAGLSDTFSVIVGKEDVGPTKPDPAPYLLALRKLGIHGFEALALEDSPKGLASAGAAGIERIAIGHRRAAGSWNEGVKYVENLRNQSEILRLLHLG